MAYQEYILFNGQPFLFTTRNGSKFEIGGSIERSINGVAHKDYVTTKHKWSFLLESISDLERYRLEKIYDTHAKITMTDFDGAVYTALWVSEFAPEMIAIDCWNITVDLEEV